jgi:hypothetical protein
MYSESHVYLVIDQTRTLAKNKCTGVAGVTSTIQVTTTRTTLGQRRQTGRIFFIQR